MENCIKNGDWKKILGILGLTLSFGVFIFTCFAYLEKKIEKVNDSAAIERKQINQDLSSIKENVSEIKADLTWIKNELAKNGYHNIGI